MAPSHLLVAEDERARGEELLAIAERSNGDTAKDTFQMITDHDGKFKGRQARERRSICPSWTSRPRGHVIPPSRLRRCVIVVKSGIVKSGTADAAMQPLLQNLIRDQESECEADLRIRVSLSLGRETTCLAESYHVDGRGVVDNGSKNSIHEETNR